MKNNFDILLMHDAKRFVKEQDLKSQKKIAYVLQKSRKVKDSKIFKKLNSNIWEFRISSNNRVLRLFAFWDSSQKALVVCTHGLHKKTQKTPKKEIERAEALMKEYLNQ